MTKSAGASVSAKASELKKAVKENVRSSIPEKHKDFDFSSGLMFGDVNNINLLFKWTVRSHWHI